MQSKYSMRQLIIVTISLLISACAGTRPTHLGTIQTSLQPCPDSPNCVSSNAEPSDEEHYIEAIAVKDRQDPSKALITTISTDPQAEIIVKSSHYIYAEYTSTMLGFVDDVEFLFDSKLGRFDIRSASRLGSRDFGANRKRIETLRRNLPSKK